MNGPRGFTLIEMVVVVALVGILAAVAHPVAQLVVRRSEEAALHRNLRTLREAIDAYKRAADAGHIEQAADASGYPPTLQALVEGVPDRRDGKGRKLYFLRRLPRDPFGDPGLDAARTWGLRSSDSPPDAPRPGADVFDVHSLSPRTALDGTRYEEW